MSISKSRFVFVTSVLCLVLVFCTSFSQLSAKDTTSVKKWNFVTDIYFIFPYMKGDIGIGNSVTAPVDATPGDIFSKLKFGSMLYLEAQTKKWAVTSDLIYMSLNQDITTGDLWHSGSAGVKQFIWEPAGFYRLASFLEVGAGGRLNNLQASIDARRNVFPAGTEEVIADASKTWIDPIVITRLTTHIKNKWLFQLRGDAGGFGVGSDFTWQVQAYAGYRFTKVFQINAGYRYLSMDYDKGTDADRFIYNVDTFGPEVSLGFNF